MPLSKKNRELALGKMTIKGKKNIFTKGGQKIASKAGDKTITNKRGEKVVVRKGGNRVITKADGRVVRIKRDGTRVVSIPARTDDPKKLGWAKVPAGLKAIRGSKLNPPKKTETGT